MTKGRRQFLKLGGLATAMTIAAPGQLSSVLANEKPKLNLLKKGNTILFQGDSITDSGRNRTDLQGNSASALGNGYALIASSQLLQRFPDLDLKIFNRGVSGNKVYQLAERWDAESLNLKPDVLSILVGVNDFWHRFLSGYKGTVKTYSDDYRKLLDQSLKQLPSVKLIIGEPYAIKGVKAVDDKWYPDFDAYRESSRLIAKEYKAVFIPYQEIYDKAIKRTEASYWTPDGVHPSLAGAALMANAWLEAVL